MKVVYDADADILQITFFKSVIEETTQIAPGLVLDYDEDGRVVGLELRKASQRVDEPDRVHFELGSANSNKPQPKINE